MSRQGLLDTNTNLCLSRQVGVIDIGDQGRTFVPVLRACPSGLMIGE